jgi:hypothetical protein
MKKKYVIVMAFMVIYSMVYSQTTEKSTKEKSVKSINTIETKKKHAFKVEVLEDKSWAYLILEGDKIVLHSADLIVHPNKFASEKEALQAAEIKIKELEKGN